METDRKFGWIPDIPDYRDLTFKLNRVLAQNLPPKVDLRFACPPIQNQYNLGCCTGFGVSAAVQYDQLSQKDPDAFHPSEMFIYYNAREILGTIEQDSGAMIRDAIQSIGKIGVCPIDLWPYDIPRFKEKPPQTAYDAAIKYVATTYSRVPQNIIDLKACLAGNNPFVFGFTVYDSMMSTEVQKTGILNMPQPGEKMHGGHCVIAVGYDDEIQRFIIRNSWGCYDEDTEVLTKDGFKYFENLNYNEEFATLNSNEDLEYQKCINKTVAPYIGYMKVFKSSKIDLIVTPNHNMFIKNKSKKNFEIIKAENIKNKRFQIKRDSDWKGQYVEFFNLPGYEHNINAYKKTLIEEKQIEMNIFLEFLGYYISEGCVSKQKCKLGGYEYRVTICQKKQNSRIIIKKCLDKLNFNYCENKEGFHINNKQLYLYCKQFGKHNDKFIPKELLFLHKSQLKHLFDALMIGDGSITKSKNSFKATYYTTSKLLADDFQELCLKIGYSSSIYKDDRVGSKSTKGYNYNYICYQIRIQNSFSLKRTKLHTVENNKKDIFYDGNVYCVTVPNHILFIRRNGKTCWCGNSEWGQQGYFTMPYEYVTNENLAADIWVVEDVKI